MSRYLSTDIWFLGGRAPCYTSPGWGVFPTLGVVYAWLHTSEALAPVATLAPKSEARTSAPVREVVDADVPFRWDVHRRSTLGTYLSPEFSLPHTVDVDAGFADWLTRCCARVVARSEGGDLYFVGRSPENLYDHLCGLLEDTSHADMLHLFQFSTGKGIQEARPAGVRSLRRYMTALGLDPRDVAARSRPVVLVDVVCSGGTFCELVSLLCAWAREEGVPWRAIRRRLRIVALVNASWHSGMDRPSDNDWQERSDWVPRHLAPRAVHNVVISYKWWTLIGNELVKVTPSYTPVRWGAPEAMRRPDPSVTPSAALPLAYGLYAYGERRERRLLFARLLARDVAMKQRWCRSLVRELRQGRATRRGVQARRAS